MKRTIAILLPALLAGCHSGSKTQCINELADDPVCELDKSVPQSLPALSSGSITSGAVTDTSLTVNWSAAVGEDKDVLWYLVVATEKKEIIESIEALKAAIANRSSDVVISNEWAKDITTGTIKDLKPGTAYKVTVLVRNRGGKITAYNIIDLTTNKTAADPSAGPKVGTAIAASTIQKQSISITWGAATSPANESLSYKVVFAASPDIIDTVEEAEAMPTSGVVKDWTKDLLTAEATSLTPNTNYSFAVLVKDESGRLALYSPQTLKTLAGKKKIFSTAGEWPGDMGAAPGFSGTQLADANCNSDTNYPGSGTYKALIASTQRRACSEADCTETTVGRVDWVFSPNTDYERVDGTAIGSTDANALLIFPLSVGFDDRMLVYASGLNGSWGTLSDHNCNGWTSSTSAYSLGYGLMNATDSMALSAEATPCDSTVPLTCIEQ